MGLDDFYTLPKIHDYHVEWQPQIMLQNYLKNFNQKLGGLQEEELASYLFKELQANPDDELLKRIWQCWLSKYCLKIAQLMQRNLSGYFQQYELADLFQYCYKPIQNPVNFLSPFKFDYSEKDFYSALKSYCYGKLKLCFYDTMRKVNNNNNIGITNLGLAVRSSRKKWREVATNSLEIEQFTLLWGCVNESKNIQNPCHKWTEIEFKDIGDRYNQLIGKLAIINGEIVREMLENIGKRIRLLAKPPIISMDSPVSSEQENINLIDTIPDPIVDAPYEEEITQLTTCISNTINQLKPPKKNIAFLYFYLGLNQQETAAEINKNQSTVSRFIVQIFSKIANEFNPNFNQQPTSEELKFLKETIQEFYYEHEINKLINPTQHSLLKGKTIDFIINKIEINFDVQLTNNARDKLVNLVKQKLSIFNH